MLLKRINYEYEKLISNIQLPENERDIINVQRVDNDFTISFHGPKGSYYENIIYTVLFVATEKYPFYNPNLYWVGNAPDHYFYRHESNSIMLLKGTTNIANTDFGIYYEWYSPAKSVIDIIKRIQYSLTLEGEKELSYCMSSKKI